MNGKLNHVVIDGIKYPIKCDNLVLEEIQEKYGTINRFELEITGLKIKTDKNGEILHGEDDGILYEKIEPSVKAINFALPLMINEGIAIEAEEEGKKAELIEKKAFLRDINTSFLVLAKIVKEEFKQCFLIKKESPGEKVE
ncbi:MAG: hypothetical protein RRY99_09565 [Flavobacterium sp.]